MENPTVEILLVEDNPSDVELTLHNLRRHKLANHIEVARDGAEALAKLQARENRVIPRLVLLDLKLPKVDGLEVLRKLKADPRTASIPVVMLTSSREERDIVESYSLGVNSYIVKPVDFEQFSQTIRQLGLYWLVVNQPPPG
jgi:two-component system response regulator